ncbi:unnamed protein product [Macrosiphum euphorbiae]|uniref:Uncharacterized protein n=1 Tax=Macrosiphum euphorbiae TaxID=13131 RepID=A0AAV0W094_9HEMI|nr:unnamed protein product [Macrosiphum euphorbiae]
MPGRCPVYYDGKNCNFLIQNIIKQHMTAIKNCVNVHMNGWYGTLSLNTRTLWPNGSRRRLCTSSCSAAIRMSSNWTTKYESLWTSPALTETFSNTTATRISGREYLFYTNFVCGSLQTDSRLLPFSGVQTQP